jgi:hypothetical protein
MGLTDALRNESHPVTVYLMTRFGRRDALSMRWHADLDGLTPAGEVLDADLAARLGDGFELCAVADLADVPPYLSLLEALDPGITEGFLKRAGFEPPRQQTERSGMIMPRFAGWRKATPAAATPEKEITEFLGQAWIMANLRRHFRELVWDLDEQSLRRLLTSAHNDLWPGRRGAAWLRPLWEAYVTAGRAQLRWLGSMTAAEPEFAAGWARGDLILGSTLIDIKTGWDVRDHLDYCLNQLLGYLLLNPTGGHPIDRVGIYLARHATTVSWPISTLLPELAGQPAVDLHCLKQEFADICRPAIDEHLARQRSK